MSEKIRLLRFPLMLLVVLIHARFSGPDYPDFATRLFSESVTLGKLPHCAVLVFFFCSGYLFIFGDERSYLEMIRR